MKIKKHVSLIIINGTVLTMDCKKNIIENGVVVIDNHRIRDVGDKSLLDKYSSEKVIDADGGIIMPGMVNTHTHISMVIFRSLADDVPDRLTRYIFPLENKVLSEEVVYLGALHGAIEMAKSGITTFCDMYYFEEEVAKAVDIIGLRAVLGETVVKFPAPDSQESFGGIKYGETFINKYKDHNLITPAFAPHAPQTNDTEHLKIINKLSEKYNVPVIMHVAETKQELKLYHEKFSKTPVEYLNSIGMLNERFIAAHLIFINDNDIELLKSRDVGVAHNMGANIKSAKGVSPALKMFDDGLRVGLGTDGPMSGNTLDIITQMGYVAKLHKLVNKDRTAMPPYKVVEMATRGGAKALHMEDEIGSIEKGKYADIAVIETKSPNMVPIYDYYSALVYSANASNVDTVIVNGRIIVEKKELKTFSESESRNNIILLSDQIRKILKTLN